MGQKKIVPPVTPRIIQTKPGQQLIGYVLFLMVLLVTAWLSYDYGRTRTLPGNETRSEQPNETSKQLDALKQERDTLKRQVAELEKSVQQINRALAAAQSRSATPRDTVAAVEKLPEPVQKTPVVSEIAADNALRLENLRISSSERENEFEVSFSISRDASSQGRVIGTIWIAVNGFIDGTPKRLSFKTLSRDQRPYVKMGFEQRQDIIENLVLPGNFQPRNILIEAKPYGDKFTGTSGKFDWTTM